MRKVQSTPNLVEQVYTILHDNICNGVLEPDTHLIQEDIAARLEVSRQPVQQALLLLKSDGLVIESGTRRLYVAPMDQRNIAHHYQIRVALDRLAATLLIDRLTRNGDEIAKQLEREGHLIIQQGLQAQQASDAVEAVRLDMAFHSLIYKYSGNPLIANTAEPHWSFLRRVMVSVLLHAHRGDRVWKEHEEILALLLTCQTKKVEEIVTEHVLGAQAALLKALQSRHGSAETAEA